MIQMITSTLSCFIGNPAKLPNYHDCSHHLRTKID